MRSLCVEAPVSKGEEGRGRLLGAGLLRKGLRIEREGDRLYIPVTAAEGLGLPALEREFEEGSPSVRSYRDLVEVPEGLGPLLPKAFDSIGDIVVLRLEDALRPHERASGGALLPPPPLGGAVAGRAAGPRGRGRRGPVRGRRPVRGPHRPHPPSESRARGRREPRRGRAPPGERAAGPRRPRRRPRGAGPGNPSPPPSRG